MSSSYRSSLKRGHEEGWEKQLRQAVAILHNVALLT